jgi:EAL domain-containing protein (putative c-di-GMP-specific phosphodiesterase class I)
MYRRVVPFVIAAGLAFAPLVLGKLILDAHARRFGASEVEAIARRYLGRTERVLAEAVASLRDVDRAGHHGCLEDDRIAFGEAVTGNGFLRRLGVVDKNGNLMCMEPPAADKRRAFLPPLSDADVPIVVSVLEPESTGIAAAPTVVVGWRSYDETRLVAEISPGSLDIDAGPAYLLDDRVIEVLVDGTKRWLKIGRGDASGPSEIVSEARSDLFPVRVVAGVSLDAAFAATRSLTLTLTASCGAIFFVFLSLALWLNRRPEQDFEDEFHHAIRNEEFVPYFQPVMNIETGQVEGCEMLVRWLRPDGTVIAPGRFMPYAETSGHVFAMTRQIMARAAKELGPLYKRHPALKLSINLFAGHFDDRRIIEDTISIFSGSDIAFDQIVFEVTERYPLKDLDCARKIINEMHALGCRVALDDTGTGHGGLAYIQQLGIDIIKIDKMFIDAMVADLSAARIVDVLVELANSLGMGVVAEGIEQEIQIEKLKEKGVTAAQGYIFAPPLPGPLFLDLVESLVGDGRYSAEFDAEKVAAALPAPAVAKGRRTKAA